MLIGRLRGHGTTEAASFFATVRVRGARATQHLHQRPRGDDLALPPFRINRLYSGTVGVSFIAVVIDMAYCQPHCVGPRHHGPCRPPRAYFGRAPKLRKAPESSGELRR
eukprot:5917999-Alexandrium_andersonii.AAC.1